MMRLIEKGLMYGNLHHVSSRALIERYNRALKHLTGKETKLQDFHIDISGFSPEIGDEFGDPLYLNPNGCNRMFIILSTQQKSSPLLHAKFSASHGILQKFIDDNESQLFALTARDAVAGELVNSVYSVTSAADLFQIRQIEVEADTTDSHVEDARALADRIERFQKEQDAWWDDVLIAEMIELAKQTGDITKNPVRLDNGTYRQDSFYAAHFGGLYIFRDVPKPAAISMTGDDLGPLPIENVYTAGDRTRIARFLEQNGLVDSIISAPGLDAGALLRQRLDFIIVDAASDAGEDLTGVRRRDLRALARRHADKLPQEFHGLNRLLAWVETGADWPLITSEHPAYFYTLRAAQGPNRDLVNMMLSELTPMDIRQLFICHKEVFYRTYNTWGEAKKEYVANFLAEEYAVDKAGTRAQLFGPEPGMDAEPPATKAADELDNMIDRVGPWGAVKRRSPWH